MPGLEGGGSWRRKSCHLENAGTCVSFPVPRLQGDGRYKGGAVCKDVVALSLQSLKQTPAADEKERSVLIVPAAAAADAGTPLWWEMGFD